MNLLQTPLWMPLALALALAMSACRAASPDDTPPPPPSASAGAADEPADAPPAGDAVFGAAPTRADFDALLARDGGDAWYGVYIQGKKVGHGRVALRAAREDEPGAVVSRMSLDMVLAGSGPRQHMRVEETRHYAGEAPFALVASTYRLEASGAVDERSLTATPDGVVVRRSVNGERSPDKRLPPTQDTLRSALVTAPLRPAEVAPGSTARAATWSWDQLRDDEVTAVAERVSTVRRAGVDSVVLDLELRYTALGVTASTRVADDGAVLEMSVGGAMVLRLEEEAVARSGVTGFDILSTSVPVKRALGDPRRVDRLSLRARLPGGATLPSGANQRVTAGDDGWSSVVTTRGAGDAVTDDARDTALAPDALIDADHPSIRAVADDVAGSLASPREKVDALVAWVHGALEQRLATHLPTASSVLASRFGDCSEHAWLLAALARAAGVPARPVYGLAYLGDAERAFGYHAWVEVALDGRWWPVDPMWDQTSADATHLKLGEELGAVGAALGALELEILDE